ncbi:MAG: cell division protein FtsZ [Hyphomicrobiaceae bacterium]
MSDAQAPNLAPLKPRIVVIGVGGGGGNAINNMIAAGLEGPRFMVANTDAQALAASAAEHRIQLGARLTEGTGAGADQDIGEAAAEEALAEIRTALQGVHMVFIAAGMGGGTGTGATPVIARVAKELGILTVAVVTKPFLFEGKRRMRVAETGIAELRRHVDTLIVIPNQNLFKIADERTPFAEAFVLADQVLYSGVACIVDLVVRGALINLDLADVRTVLSGMGTAMMGTGEASGEQRAIVAAKDAIFNPLLDDVSLRGAGSLLLSIAGGQDLTLFEVHDAVDVVRQELDPEANIIFGATVDDSMTGRIRVSVVASGMHRAQAAQERAAGAAAAQQAAANGRAKEPSRAEVASKREEARPPAQAPAHAVAKAANGEVWSGPGDVVIRERTPQSASQSSASQNRRSARGDDLSRLSVGHSGSQPPRRPMPTVEDFPLVGQREYWAKTAGARRSQQASQQPEPPPARRMGLLERITGARRAKANAGPATAERPAEEQLDMPVFFRRDQKD